MMEVICEKDFCPGTHFLEQLSSKSMVLSIFFLRFIWDSGYYWLLLVLVGVVTPPMDQWRP